MQHQEGTLPDAGRHGDQVVQQPLPPNPVTAAMPCQVSDPRALRGMGTQQPQRQVLTTADQRETLRQPHHGRQTPARLTQERIPARLQRSGHGVHEHRRRTRHHGCTVGTELDRHLVEQVERGIRVVGKRRQHDAATGQGPVIPHRHDAGPDSVDGASTPCLTRTRGSHHHRQIIGHLVPGRSPHDDVGPGGRHVHQCATVRPNDLHQRSQEFAEFLTR